MLALATRNLCLVTDQTITDPIAPSSRAGFLMRRAISVVLALSAACGHTNDPSQSAVEHTVRTSREVIGCAPGELSPRGAQVYTCLFAAPGGCRIVSATASSLGAEASESLAVTIAPDGSQVTSTVTVRPPQGAAVHRSAPPRISITAKLECSEGHKGTGATARSQMDPVRPRSILRASSVPI